MTAEHFASIGFALVFIGCACGIAFLVWDGRQRTKPVVRPTVPMDERMPPA